VPITDFNDRLAFVTGGASGIGLGIARSLAARGARVVLADIRSDHIDQALAGFESAGQADRVSALELDVTDRDGFEAAAATMQADHGGVDILVNNAGIGVEGPLLQAGYSDWDWGVGVNFLGVVNGIQAFRGQMIAHGRGGHIVNTASLAATIVMPGFLAIYAATKAAVLNLSENMRADFADVGIGVSVLCPGFVKSNIHESGQNRPQKFRGDSGFVEAEKTLSQREVGDDWMEPDAVGDMVANAIRDNELYVITHGEFRNLMRARADAWFAATPHAKFQFGE